jgi:hypothetical protein
MRGCLTYRKTLILVPSAAAGTSATDSDGSPETVPIQLFD